MRIAYYYAHCFSDTTLSAAKIRPISEMHLYTVGGAVYSLHAVRLYMLKCGGPLLTSTQSDNSYFIPKRKKKTFQALRNMLTFGE